MSRARSGQHRGRECRSARSRTSFRRRVPCINRRRSPAIRVGPRRRSGYRNGAATRCGARLRRRHWPRHRAGRQQEGYSLSTSRSGVRRSSGHEAQASMAPRGSGACRRMWLGRRRAMLGDGDLRDQATRSARGMPSAAILFSARTATLASTRWAPRPRDRSSPPSTRFSREKVHSAALRRP